MSEETIMPDGRPLFAWQNELKMLRKENQDAVRAIEETSKFKQLMIGIYEQWKESETLDWVIRVKAIDAVTATDFKYHLENYLRISHPLNPHPSEL